MSEKKENLVKTKWLPRHLLDFQLYLPFFGIRTDLMSYNFESHSYHYLRFQVVLFKWGFNIDIGRDEKREIAHETYKRMAWDNDTPSDAYTDLRNMNSLPDMEKRHIAECKKRVAERKKSANIEASKQWWRNARI